MAIKPGQGLANWEVATLRKILGEYGRRHPSFDHGEYEDLLQECLAHWIAVRGRLPQGPDIPPPVAYMAQVVRHKLTDIVRERYSDKRAGAPGALSFEEPIAGDQDGRTLGEEIAEGHLAASAGLLDNERERQDLRIDLARVMAHMKPADQELCRLLGEQGLTVTEASEDLRVPRGTVYEQIRRIRERLRRLGLEEYLKK